MHGNMEGFFNLLMFFVLYPIGFVLALVVLYFAIFYKRDYKLDPKTPLWTTVISLILGFGLAFTVMMFVIDDKSQERVFVSSFSLGVGSVILIIGIMFGVDKLIKHKKDVVS